jgi:hypothetical protein
MMIHCITSLLDDVRAVGVLGEIERPHGRAWLT